METLHRLAGVQDALDFSSAQPAQLVSNSDAHPRDASAAHDQEGEAGMGTYSNRASRASLPLNRQPSRKSLREGRSGGVVVGGGGDAPPTPRLHKFNSDPNHGGPQPPIPRISSETAPVTEAGTAAAGAAGDDDDGFAWGPTHPCFPHPNPHCLPTSAEFAHTRVIRVRRDWLMAGDLYPQYANLYPEILDPGVGDAEFRALVSRVNAICARAFSPYTARAWLDGVLGVLTGFLWEDLGLTGARRGARELERFIDRWNGERRAEGREVRVVQLKTTGFMNLDFIVPDPGIDAVEERERGQGVEVVVMDQAAE